MHAKLVWKKLTHLKENFIKINVKAEMKMVKMERKILVGAIIIAAIIIVGGFTYFWLSRPKVIELVVWEWSGYEVEEVWFPFKENNPDVKVSHVLLADNDAAIARIAAGDRPDITHFGGDSKLYLDRHVALDAVEPINLSLIPNWENVHPYFKNYVTEFSTYNGKVYWVPTDWGSTSIVYRRDLLEAAGLPEPDSWSVFWNSSYAEVGTAMYDSPSEIGGIMFLALNYTLEDFHNPTDEQLETWKNTLQTAFEQAAVIYDDQYELLAALETGEVAVGSLWEEPWAVGLADGYDLGYVSIPPAPDFREGENTVTWVSGLSIGKGAKDRGTYELAHDYINSWLDPRVGSYVIENYYYGSPNEEAIEMADPDVVEMLGLTDPETKLEKGVLYSYNMPDSATWDEYFEAWTAAKAAAAV